MQDDTQRTEAATASTPGAQQPQSPPQPQQAPPTTTPTQNTVAQPATESTVAPRGLENLRTESGGVEPRGFGTLGIAPTPEGPGLSQERADSIREVLRSEAARDPLPFHTDLDTSLPYGYEPQEPMYLPVALSVGAGFKFGCGFMLALGVSLFGLFLAASVIFFVAALAGVPMPGATP